jgi:uncharacterized protein YjiS (DUF1127 family)
MQPKEAAMSIHSVSDRAGHPRSLWSRVRQHLAAMATVARHRKALAKLEPRLLRDIGLTTEEAEAELSRPVWDVPAHWRS